MQPLPTYETENAFFCASFGSAFAAAVISLALTETPSHRLGVLIIIAAGILILVCRPSVRKRN